MYNKLISEKNCSIYNKYTILNNVTFQLLFFLIKVN